MKAEFGCFFVESVTKYVRVLQKNAKYGAFLIKTLQAPIKHDISPDWITGRVSHLHFSSPFHQRIDCFSMHKQIVSKFDIR